MNSPEQLDIDNLDARSQLEVMIKALTMNKESDPALIKAIQDLLQYDDEILELVKSSKNVITFQSKILEREGDMTMQEMKDKYGAVMEYYNAKSRSRLNETLRNK